MLVRQFAHQQLIWLSTGWVGIGGCFQLVIAVVAVLSSSHCHDFQRLQGQTATVMWVGGYFLCSSTLCRGGGSIGEASTTTRKGEVWASILFVRIVTRQWCVPSGRVYSTSLLLSHPHSGLPLIDSDPGTNGTSRTMTRRRPALQTGTDAPCGGIAGPMQGSKLCSE
jgi:hypothetical protein